MCTLAVARVLHAGKPQHPPPAAVQIGEALCGRARWQPFFLLVGQTLMNTRSAHSHRLFDQGELFSFIKTTRQERTAQRTTNTPKKAISRVSRAAPAASCHVGAFSGRGGR